MFSSCVVVVAQIVSHSRSQDGTWLNPENLRQILTGLDSCPTGQWGSSSSLLQLCCLGFTAGFHGQCLTVNVFGQQFAVPTLTVQFAVLCLTVQYSLQCCLSLYSKVCSAGSHCTVQFAVLALTVQFLQWFQMALCLFPFRVTDI